MFLTIHLLDLQSKDLIGRKCSTFFVDIQESQNFRYFWLLLNIRKQLKITHFQIDLHYTNFGMIGSGSALE